MKKVIHFWPVFVLILQVPIVIMSFKLLPSKQIAGLVGSVLFFSLGVILANHFFKKLYTKSFALYTLIGHIFIFVIPIFCLRMANWSTPFEEIQVMGLRASSLHSLSEKYYVIVLWAAIYDCMKIARFGGTNYFDRVETTSDSSLQE
ncbi:MAG: hypothetical protein VX642_04020 [Bdellovibrionota bacterium]|nr:hypothetical protein [Bdellovibrionota bacterium]